MAQTQYQPGQQIQNTLVGSELVEVDNGGAVVASTPAASIAALASKGVSQQITETAITTVGNGTLTGAALVGGQIARTGPTAAFTDTTQTAAQIVAALPQFVSGATIFFRIKNATLFQQTLAAGNNVTLPGNIVNPPFSAYWAYGVIGGTAAVPTVTIVHMATTPIFGTQNSAPQLVTAAGASQGNATAITSLNAIITVATTVSTHGVRLPAASTGIEVEIANAGAFGVKVYPATGCKIGSAVTNAADTTTLAINKVNRYKAVNTTLWVVQRGA